jgi:hypothetical protein
MGNIDKKKRRTKELKKKNNIRKNNVSKNNRPIDTRLQNEQINQLAGNMKKVNEQMTSMLTLLDDKLEAFVDSLKTRSDMFEEDFSEDIEMYKEAKASLNDFIVKSNEQFNQLKLVYGMDKMIALEEWLTEVEKGTTPLLVKYNEVLDKFQDQFDEKEFNEYKEFLNGHRTDNITEEEIQEFKEEVEQENIN